jgi:hypothetical protein
MEHIYACHKSGAPHRRPPYAYFSVVAPVSPERRSNYKPWLISAITAFSALRHHGSTADFMVLLGTDLNHSHTGTCLYHDDESMLARAQVRWRCVPAPHGFIGFNSGHFKLWLWQHTEYSKVQLIDADVLPLANLDAYFELPTAVDAALIGCPGLASILNAGWFVAHPSCATWRGLRALLQSGVETERGSGWGGWQLPNDGWTDAWGRNHSADWSFFDAEGSQGQ